MTLDLRYNAIESPDDFLTFIDRAKENGESHQTVIITPQQHDDLLANSAATLGLFAGPIKTFYGYRIVQQEQD